MANILISYDVSSNHVQMKQKMKSLGYTDVVALGNENLYLPNTTLVKFNTTATQGKLDMQTSANSVGTRLQRAISVEIGSAVDGISGDPHQ